MSAIVNETAISIPPRNLPGDLTLCRQATGVVLFAHGSGSSRHSVRNRSVARVLQSAGFDTLLLDLLTPSEEEIDIQTRQYRFDIGLLAERLGEAIDWLSRQEATKNLPIGLFGASTGAAAALIAGAQHPSKVGAVVSRGGRPDLAGFLLPHLKAPTLLIVGGEDHAVMALNRETLEQLRCPRQLAIVPGATHLFEEPGTLEEVSALAREWFATYLSSSK